MSLSSTHTQCAAITGLLQTNRHAYLTAGRAGQKLTQGNQIGISRITEPAAAMDKFFAEIRQMGDRAAKRGESQTQEGNKEDGGADVRFHGLADCSKGETLRSTRHRIAFSH